MNAIFSVDLNNAIGNNNELIYRIPDDLRQFKKLTINKVIIMGRKTYESIGKALPDRINIVLSSKKIKDKNVITINSADDPELSKYNPDDMYVIGGSETLKLFEHKLQTLFVTHIMVSGTIYDTVNPVNLNNFDLILFGEIKKFNDIQFMYAKYRKKIFLKRS